MSTLIHSCCFKSQQHALGQFWIGRVGQYSSGADTYGAISCAAQGLELDHEQRFNHFPASPLCAICWLFQGDAAVVRRGDQWVHEATPRIALIGPHSGPVVSHNPGAVEALMVAMTPAAVQALSGVSISALINRVVPLEDVLFDASWLTTAQTVLQDLTMPVVSTWWKNF